ncbi:MAG TPA: P1 family peptidase [Candidatus Limnocylindrales bacterium]|nr:P1 family peptidase [Candidatus Limnocylindrales bacterium]
MSAGAPRPQRARDLGIVIGEGRPGPQNAITDVRGVRVGHTTLISGEGPLVVGRGPIRTGVTVILPHDGDPWAEPVFAGSFALNGNGELTGLPWIAEAGLLHGPIGLTNTLSVGLVRDALASHGLRARGAHGLDWALPVAGETWDGQLNDIAGGHVRPEHVDAALAAAEAAPLGAAVPEGGVGGGTGMVCHEFKGGIGTASRVLAGEAGGWTVGVLVQANYGRRDLLRIDGVPVGQAISIDEVPSPYGQARRRGSDGSIIGIVATDAPLLPHQCQRVARRFAVGLARVGGIGATTSGDLFLAFATGNRGMPPAETEGVAIAGERPGVLPLRGLADRALDPIFEATVEATEEAIVNALVAAETMTGRDGITAPRLPHERLVEVMRAAGRLRGHP